jgi:peptidoglycan DL-endopeptidase LytF
MKKIKTILFASFFIFISFLIFCNEFIEYEIKKGETIWRISQNFNISVKELCKINNIEDITKIKAGMIIKVPQINQKESQKTASYGIHILQKGETIWQLSKKYKIQADELCKINNIENLNKLLPGMKIKFPQNINQEISLDKTDKSSSSEDNFTYTLKKGESLWSISRKYKVNIKEICSLNNIDDVNKIKTGVVIKLPLKVEYLDYKIPLNGEINIFQTSHFRGIHIFCDEDPAKRNVFAIEKGEVSYIDTIPGYGLSVFIKHENGLLSTYSGLDSTIVKVGDKVDENSLIGLAGKLSRYNKFGILFSIQEKGFGLAFDMKKQKFIKI